MASSENFSPPVGSTGLLDQAEYTENFSDLHPPYSAHEARIEAERCYFCYDAPCVNACPTAIDIPLFIRQISTGSPVASAKTIFTQNILGGICARVCPTETLCEQVCVRQVAEGKPIKIGRLQRYATDHLMAKGGHPFTRAARTRKRIAIVGGGPAGLSCAHRLARYGHDVTIFDKRQKAGGLNEYGIASYKTVDDFAWREVQFVTNIGGIEINIDKSLGVDFTVAELTAKYDAVFLALGLANVNALGMNGEEAGGCIDAVDYIARLRQVEDLSKMPVGKDIVVIGGGMTAIDVAVQTKLLGAQNVTIAYRRGADQMGASPYEQNLAKTSGVTIRHWLQPDTLELDDAGNIVAIRLEHTSHIDDRLQGSGEFTTLAADMVFKAIGQKFSSDPLTDSNIELEHGRIAVNDQRQTSRHGVWAGGDCITGGEDLTVVAVEDGKLAAESIHRTLSA